MVTGKIMINNNINILISDALECAECKNHLCIWKTRKQKYRFAAFKFELFKNTLDQFKSLK